MELPLPPSVCKFVDTARDVENDLTRQKNWHVKNNSTKGFIFDQKSAFSFFLNFQHFLRLFRATNTLTKTLKFVAGSRFFSFNRKCKYFETNNFAKNAAGDRQNAQSAWNDVSRWPANYKTIAGNRRMQPVTGEMTWFGLLATHKEKKMGASTIF